MTSSCPLCLQNSNKNIDWWYTLLISIQNGGGYTSRSENLIVKSTDIVWFSKSWMSKDKVFTIKYD